MNSDIVFGDILIHIEEGENNVLTDLWLQEILDMTILQEWYTS